MKAIKYILLISISIISTGITAQSVMMSQIKKVPEDSLNTVDNMQYRKTLHEDEARPVVILSSGERTVVVNKISKGLYGNDAKFLYRDYRFKDVDLYRSDETRYRSLEEATYDTQRLLNLLDEDKSKTGRETNRSLSYRTSQVERMKRTKEQKVVSLRDSLLEKKSDPKKIAELDAKFGKRPTYYINGIEAEYEFVEFLFPDEILGREIKVVNTRSGNPNGEIWYKVPDHVLFDIGLLNKNELREAKNDGEVKDVLEFIKVKEKQSSKKKK